MAWTIYREHAYAASPQSPESTVNPDFHYYALVWDHECPEDGLLRLDTGADSRVEVTLLEPSQEPGWVPGQESVKIPYVDITKAGKELMRLQSEEYALRRGRGSRG